LLRVLLLRLSAVPADTEQLAVLPEGSLNAPEALNATDAIGVAIMQLSQSEFQSNAKKNGSRCALNSHSSG
jgi:hypothetical protein